MTRPAGQCPNCNGPIQFRWSSAVQTTCPHCRSVVVRHDVDLDAVGETSDLPPDSSPIQIGTTGRFDDRPFTVAGRIAYEHDGGYWNEWHLLFDDESSGWLSDAQAEYAVSVLESADVPLPAREALKVGLPYTWRGANLLVTTVTEARYTGVEGELPFEFWGRDAMVSADLRGHDATFATFDYSEPSPRLFVGRLLEYDELSLRNVRALDDRTVTNVRGFNCGNCGAAVELRALGHARSAVCTSCAAVLDPRDPNLYTLQTSAEKLRVEPTLPLGSRGTLDGHTFDIVGFQRRSIEVDGTQYHWDEYLLFHPYQGFRYLSEYDGHWNVIRMVRELPQVRLPLRHVGEDSPRLGDHAFRHFQTAKARTDFVLGEFPWRARAGEVVEVHDYVSPPWMLSAEGSGREVTWSLGLYTSGEAIWKAFAVANEPPTARGVYANQPWPHAATARSVYRTFAALATLLLLVLLWRMGTAANEEVIRRSDVFRPGATSETAFVTDPFTLRAPGTVDIEIGAELQNAWLYFDLALINMESGSALNLGREVGYYTGVDGDGSWTEGSRQARIVLPSVSAGEYYLRVEPEGGGMSGPVPYRLQLRRDRLLLLPYGLALALLAIPPVIFFVMARRFEHARWQESDHGGGGDDDDDD
jgi:hypothetical protein